MWPYCLREGESQFTPIDTAWWLITPQGEGSGRGYQETIGKSTFTSGTDLGLALTCLSPVCYACTSRPEFPFL